MTQDIMSTYHLHLWFLSEKIPKSLMFNHKSDDCYLIEHKSNIVHKLKSLQFIVTHTLNFSHQPGHFSTPHTHPS